MIIIINRIIKQGTVENSLEEMKTTKEKLIDLRDDHLIKICLDHMQKVKLVSVKIDLLFFSGEG